MRKTRQQLSEPTVPVRLESEVLVAFRSIAMAPRANWKGFLRLSLVTCPVALFPATSDSEKISFNQINRKTGHRIKYAKVDADTGEEVANDDIMKGYKVDTDTYIEVSKDELENLALESTRTIDIDEFVPKSDIDPRYLIRPYYLVPDGKVGHDAFAVIRETIRSMDKVAIGRVVLTNREHIIALEPLEKGLMGTLLRYPYEVRDEKEYFDEIQDVKVTKDMLDLAKHNGRSFRRDWSLPVQLSESVQYRPLRRGSWWGICVTYRSVNGIPRHRVYARPRRGRRLAMDRLVGQPENGQIGPSRAQGHRYT
jgi:Ku protein